MTIAVLAALACSSSSNKGSASTYSGPSCPSGQPTTTAMDGVPAQCVTCLQNACTTSSQTTCFNSTCSAYFSCYCQCALGDTTCQMACPLSSACTTCEEAVGQCYLTAETGSCASDCATDGGSTGSTSSSSGGATATGVCATLVTCCSSLGTAASGCESAASSNDESECQIALSALTDAGICH